MHAQDLEPELEALLLRHIPGLAQEWEGATPDEIARIEALMGRPLPRFYRWFLMRMGKSMGPIAYPTLDFSAARVLACYEERLFTPNPRFFMIGYETDEVMPLHMLYDFEHPAREDFRVTKRHAMGGPLYDQFATFREMVGWGELLMLAVKTRPQQCIGMLKDRSGDFRTQLDPLMVNLGFTIPVETGPCCALYESPLAAMITSATPCAEPTNHFFHLGGPDAGHLRRILGEIVSETTLELKLKPYAWTPPLS